MNIQPQFTFDPATHTYRLNGERVVGVTEALQRTKLIDYSGIPRDVLDRAAARGTAVHLMLEYYDRGTLDESCVPTELAGYLRAYQSFCEEAHFTPASVEGRRYHAVRRYAGTFDRTGYLDDKLLVLLDFKTGLVQDGHMLQLAGYVQMMPQPRRFRPMALKLSDNCDYRVHEIQPRQFIGPSAEFFSAVLVAQKQIAREARN